MHPIAESQQSSLVALFIALLRICEIRRRVFFQQHFETPTLRAVLVTRSSYGRSPVSNSGIKDRQTKRFFRSTFRSFRLVFCSKLSPYCVLSGKTVIGQGGFMTTKTTSKATKKSVTRRRTSRKASPLATCPTGGAGWCAYPFSVAQLQKRMKTMSEQAQSEKELAAAGSTKDSK